MNARARQRHQWRIWQLLFVICSTTWLWGPALNPGLLRHNPLISDYEAAGMPWGWVFRLFDMLAALLLLAAAYKLSRRAKGATRLPRFGLVLLWLIALGSLVDGLFPVTRGHIGGLTIHAGPAYDTMVHDVESTLTAVAIGVLALVLSLKRHVKSQIILGSQLLLLLMAAAYKYGGHESMIVQTLYEVAVVLWLADLPQPISLRPSRWSKRLRRRPAGAASSKRRLKLEPETVPVKIR